MQVWRSCAERTEPALQSRVLGWCFIPSRSLSCMLYTGCCVLIPAMVANTFYLRETWSLHLKKMLILCFLRMGEQAAQVEPQHPPPCSFCDIHQVRQDPWVRPGVPEEFLQVTAVAVPCGAITGCPASTSLIQLLLCFQAGEGSMQLHSQALIRALHKQMAGLCWKDSIMDLTIFFMASLRASAGTPHRGPVLILHCPVHFWHLRSPSVNSSTTVVSRDLVLLELVSTCAGRSPYEGISGCTPAHG